MMNALPTISGIIYCNQSSFVTLLREYDWVYLTFEKLALFEMKSVYYQKAQIKIEC